jgi:hypothetical protein
VAYTLTQVRQFTINEQVTNTKLNDVFSSGTIADLSNSELAAGAGIDISKIDWAGADGDIGITKASTTTNIFAVTGSSLSIGSLGYFYSNSADASARNLVSIVNDHASADAAVCLYFQQDGNAPIIKLIGDTNPVGISTNYAIYLNNINGLSTGGIAYFHSGSAGTDARNLVTIINEHGDADAAICLKLQQNGAGQQILGHSNENLSNAGVWTDRTSTYADKTDITPLVVTGFIDKLKNLKLFEYRKKCEVYGNKQDILHETEKDENGKPKVKGKKYPEIVKHQNAPIHKGYILDDPSTPEELISRNSKGEIDGISATRNVNFLLAVCKELIARVEILEADPST